jgi:RHS repeat-associated protein
VAYYYQDELGSTSHIADASGALLEYYKYDLYGRPQYFDSTSQPLNASTYGVKDLFTGQRWVTEIGLYDDRNRFMSPDLGRFLQPDPIGFKGDASNLYRYCRNDWANKTDPLGLYVVLVDPYGQPLKDAARDIAQQQYDKGREQATTNEDGTKNSKAESAFKSIEGNKAVKVNISIQKYVPKGDVFRADIKLDSAGRVISGTIDIKWNPNLARVNTNGTKNSPAGILLHEALHGERAISDPLGFNRDFQGGESTANKRIANPEEKRVLKLERQIYPQLRHEGVRDDLGLSKWEKVESPDEGGGP